MAEKGDNSFYSENPSLSSEYLNPENLQHAMSFAADEPLTRIFTKKLLDFIDYSENHRQDDLLRFVLDQVGEMVQSPIGFYHFVDEDQKNLKLQQWSTRTLQEFCQTTGKGLHYSMDQAGVWVDCVRIGRPVIHNDYDSLPHKKGLPPGHARVIRELVVPVMRHGKVKAILGVGNKPRDYTQRDVDLVSYMADLTWEIIEKKQVSQVIQEKQELFKASFFHNPTPMVIVNIKTQRLVVFNQGFMELTGREENWLLTRHLEDMGLFQGPRFINGALKIIQRRKSLQDVPVLIHSSSETKDVRINATLLESNPQELLLLAIRDISPIKKSLNALKVSEAHFRSLFDNLSSGVVVFEAWEAGEDFILQDMNEAARDICSFNLAVKGKKFLSQLCPDARDMGMLDSLQNCFLTGKNQFLPQVIYKSSRLSRWMECHIFRLPDKRVVAIYEDRSEQKKMEERLHQSEKIEALGHLAGGIAHDFNNILGAIIGYTDLALSEYQQEEPLTHYLQQIMSAGDRAKLLVEQILTFSRRGSKAQHPVMMGSLVKEALSLLQASLPASVNIQTNIEKDSTPVLANATQIHEVVMNLCVNASHAMGKRGLMLVNYKEIQRDQDILGLMGSSPPGNYSMLEVVDQGCGISVELIHRIFEPFFSTKEVGKGTGMGLSMVFGIVRSHRGNLQLESSPGEGSTFRIFIPKHINNPVEAELPQDRKTGRILVVDDEPVLTSFIEHSLSSQGYQVDAFQRSMEAFKAFQEDPQSYDLLITDQLMPVLSGLELSNEIIKIRPDLPIILCSGNKPLLDHLSKVESSFRAFCPKPLEKKELHSLISEILEQTDSQQS